MKHTKLLVLALLVALIACLAVAAQADCATEGHSWVYDATAAGNKPAGCETEGAAVYRCVVCNTVEFRALPAHGHARSNNFVCVNDLKANCGTPYQYYEECAYKCGHYFTDNSYTVATGIAHTWKNDDGTWNITAPGITGSCTADGKQPIVKCKVCGAIHSTYNGSVIKATGHDITGESWYETKPATCASEGKKAINCHKCGKKAQEVATPKLTYHVDAAFNPINQNDGYIMVNAGIAPTCTTSGCWPVYACPTCGARDTRDNRNGGFRPATGHRMVVDGNPDMTYLPTCTKAGQTVLYCANKPDLGNGPVQCDHIQVIPAPALGHSAAWKATTKAAPAGEVYWELTCGKCGAVLAAQLMKAGQNPSTGTVNTGKQAVDQQYDASKTGLKEIAKTTTKKTTTKKSTTTKTTAAAKTTTAAAAAPATTALKTGIVVLNDAVAVQVKDGKATLLNAAADDETVALYATADAEPVAMVVGEAVEFADGAAVAIVKTADMPAATASK